MNKDNTIVIRTPSVNDGAIPASLEEFTKMGYTAVVVWDSENEEFVVTFTK